MGDRLNSKMFQLQSNEFAHYHYLTLQILHGPPDLAPFSTAACEYEPDFGARAPVFRIRGYYAVSSIQIPENEHIQLRPVNPF